MRVLAMAVLLMASVSVAAGQWEYRVIHLPGTVDISNPMSPKPRTDILKSQPSGYHMNSESTDILSNYGRDGWEIVGVTGMAGGSHAVFLKRQTD